MAAWRQGRVGIAELDPSVTSYFRETTPVKVDYAAAAAGSMRADWRAGVEYAEQLRGGVQRSISDATKVASALEDSHELVPWLIARGYWPRHDTVLMEAAKNGRDKLVAFVLEQENLQLCNLTPWAVREACKAAAAEGHGHVLEMICKERPTVLPEHVVDVLKHAACNGNHQSVRWLLDNRCGADVSCGQHWGDILEAGATSGNLGLLRELFERSPWWHRLPNPRLTLAVASAGCPAALDLLEHHGVLAWPALRGTLWGTQAFESYPSDSGLLWKHTFMHGDVLMAKSLRRLNCPWDTDLLKEIVLLAPRYDSMLVVLEWALSLDGFNVPKEVRACLLASLREAEERKEQQDLEPQWWMEEEEEGEHGEEEEEVHPLLARLHAHADRWRLRTYAALVQLVSQDARA